MLPALAMVLVIWCQGLQSGSRLMAAHHLAEPRNKASGCRISMPYGPRQFSCITDPQQELEAPLSVHALLRMRWATELYQRDRIPNVWPAVPRL